MPFSIVLLHDVVIKVIECRVFGVFFAYHKSCWKHKQCIFCTEKHHSS